MQYVPDWKRTKYVFGLLHGMYHLENLFYKDYRITSKNVNRANIQLDDLNLLKKIILLLYHLFFLY